MFILDYLFACVVNDDQISLLVPPFPQAKADSIITKPPQALREVLV
jgi:hypothetical protein